MNQQLNVIRLPEALKKTGLAKSTLYKLISSGDFPKQIQLTARSVGFLENEIDAWIQSRVNQRTT